MVDKKKQAPRRRASTGEARAYQGKSAEERVAARRGKLLEAAFTLMAEDGWRGVTIEVLCQQAALNKRYFYENFSALDEVVAAIVDGLAQEIIQQSFAVARAAREQGLSTPEVAQQALGAVITYITDDPRRARVLFSEVSESPSAIAHRKLTVKSLALALAAYGQEHHGQTTTDPIADIGSALLVGGSIEVIMAWLKGDIATSREQLIADLSQLWVYAGDGAVEIARTRKP